MLVETHRPAGGVRGRVVLCRGDGRGCARQLGYPALGDEHRASLGSTGIGKVDVDAPPGTAKRIEWHPHITEQGTGKRRDQAVHQLGATEVLGDKHVRYPLPSVFRPHEAGCDADRAAPAPPGRRRLIGDIDNACGGFRSPAEAVAATVVGGNDQQIARGADRLR